MTPTFVALALLAFAACTPAIASAQSVSKGVLIEAIAGTANMRHAFSDDCCGPTRSYDGASFGVRVSGPQRSFIRLAVEAGATYAESMDMKWIAAMMGIARPARLSPWVQGGVGIQGQIGECLADAPSTSENCTTALSPNVTASGGVRYQVVQRITLGLEGTYATAVFRRDRFSTARLAVTVGVLPR